MLKLYHTPTSVCSIKARLGLAEIGLDYESKIVDFSSSEQHGETYLKLNPDGVVPTLIDDGFVVTESSLILEYLDTYYNDGKLIPTDRKLATTARHWLLRTLAIHSAINTITFSTAARDQILASKTPDEIASSISKMPDPIARLKRTDLLANGLNSTYVTQAFGQLQRALKDMQTALTEQEWITSAEFGISDIALLSYIDRLDRLGFSGLLDSEGSQVTGWLERMKARPSYEIAIAQHIPSAVADKTRQAGETHWSEVKRIWNLGLST